MVARKTAATPARAKASATRNYNKTQFQALLDTNKCDEPNEKNLVEAQQQLQKTSQEQQKQPNRH